MKRGIWNWLFLLSSFGLVAMLLVLVGQELFPEWAGYQRAYYRRLAEVTGTRGGGPVKVRQIHLPEFHRVDRCTTCHMGIDNPKMAGQPQPFGAHPDLGIPGFLAKHPFEEVGCTVCHHGQGSATTKAHAHGPVRHWEQPLLTKELIVGACTSCHGDTATLRGAERLVQARKLFDEKGCIGCHNLHGKGMLVGPELEETWNKSPAQFDFHHVEGMEGKGHGEGTVAQWIIDHFRDPQRVSPEYPALGIPESSMPKYEFTEEEIQLLSALVLSFASEVGREEFTVPARFKVPAKPQAEPAYAGPVEHGEAVFRKYGCVGCHGPQGRGGIRNANMDLGEEVPALTYVSDGYSRDEIKEIIREGRYPGRADSAHLSPPLWMPPWKEKLSDEELEAVVEYLFSLRPPPE